jgi:hypothetical protein
MSSQPTAEPDRRTARSRRTKLVLIAGAIRGTCAGAARAIVDHLLNLL